MNLTLILQAVTLLAKYGDVLGKIVPLVLPIVKDLTGQIGSKQEAPAYDVKWLQTALNQIMAAGLVVDGDYGSETREAVREFQKKFMPGEAADGWAGVKTTAVLIRILDT